jgi:hypothetical protein
VQDLVARSQHPFFTEELLATMQAGAGELVLTR